MSKRTKDDDAVAPPAAPFNNPFAGLKTALPDLPAGPSPSTASPVKKVPKGPARAVIRLERKGHSGKEVTVVEHLELPPKEREVWLKALKAGLGCGGTLGEDGALVLQGDQRERLEPLLLKKGVRKVTVSG